jgi:tripeptidyl-peptidase-1
MSATRLVVLASIFVTLVACTRIYLDEPKPVTVPTEWISMGAANAEHEIKFLIALKQRNIEQLEQILAQVSDPESPQYGQYLSIQDLTNLLAPAEEDIAAVVSWLESHDISDYVLNTNKDFISVNAPVHKVESLLQVEFHAFKSQERKRVHVTSLSPLSIPRTLHGKIDLISHINGFPMPRKQRPTAQGRDVLSTITPDVLRTRYNVSSTAVGGHPNNTQAVAEFQEQYYSTADLKQFMQTYSAKYAKSYTVHLYGNNDESDPGVEASLDIQYILGVAPLVPTWFWSNDPFDFWSDITAWVAQLANDTNCPLVHSVSYGSQGNYPAASYRDRINNEFKKLGARGISIIFASGDSGTGCSLCYEFQPSFPATSPYVTSVGATKFIQDAIGPEQSTSWSGGGFSWHFDAPSYQSQAIQAYFQTESDLPETHYYNPTGRGTPDVAAYGENFQVIVSGFTNSVAGTSASAPTFAGIISLLNDVRLRNNKPPLGFLNPWLYQAAKTKNAFYDVTVGNNQYGCCYYTGFYCNPGWDPVTGLGTPNYAVLSKLV